MRDTAQRASVWLAAWGAMGVVLIAAAFRPIEGDTWRYNRTFQNIRTQPLFEALSNADDNRLFVALNWSLGQFGSSPLWLIMPTTIFCGFMLWYSLRQLLLPIHVAVAILLYSVYPYFVFYVASGIKQALAMAMLLQAYITLRNGKWGTLIWIGLAVLFHSGGALVLPFLALHWLTWRPRFGYRRAMTVSLSLLLVTILMSVTNLNEAVMSTFQAYLVVSDNYEIYFMDAAEVNYRAGFRPDFTVFSLLPLFAALWLRNKGRGLSPEVSGWWLNLYILLASLYQMFAFAPFADRFASFSWYLIPMILVIMLAESGRRRDLQLIVLIFALFNILILQFYTGSALRFLS
jgi:hypothetical protein